MKHKRTFTAIVLVFLIAGAFLASCGKKEDPKLEQERIELINSWDSNLSNNLNVWSHGPGHKYATYSIVYPGKPPLEYEEAKCLAETMLELPQLDRMIDIGFTKIFLDLFENRFELYIDKKAHCWKIK